LSIVRDDAEKISVGKFAGNHTLPQEDINQLLVDKAKEGKMVVRLKGGDPYIFGRGGEEAEACYENDITFEVVPGVTSAFSAPGYAGIPPTHRDCTTNVAVVTGHRKKGDDRPIDIPKAGTVIFLMSVGNIPRIIKQLLNEGWAGDTPIAVIEHGTWYDQRVIAGKLDNFLEIIKENPLRTPGIFVVGKVVEMREKLGWYSKKPRILMLGTHPDKYIHLGTIVHRQLIECVGLDDYTDADKQIGNIKAFGWIVFTSANGIRHFFARLKTKGLDCRSLANAKIGVIGATTAETLAKYGINADLCAKNQSSQGLLEAFSNVDVKGEKILLPQAEVSSQLLPDGLKEMGADVVKMPVYKTIERQCDDVDFDYIDQVLFTSGSSVRAFVKRFGQVPEHVKAYCLGLPTLSTAEENGIEAEVLPKDQE
ncbi:MAG: uroporphyrinogen-III C-methyltransferase, partial [Planctomycetes bacterium]|nr:uroporphyrinogen-III C-methyltransferase [Planctomycetota bacterium]